MMSNNNRLEIYPRAKKYFKKIKEKQLQNKFKEALAEIKADPLNAGELKKGSLAGVFCYDVYHVGVNYEIAYIVDRDEDGNLVTVILAGTRENFYEELERFWK
jgi:mRNA interferase RelE/StbE